MTTHRFRSHTSLIVHVHQLRSGTGTKFGPTPRGTFCPRLLRLIQAV